MTSDTDSSSGFTRNGWVILILIAVTLALYRPVIGFEFVNYDDNLYLTDNPTVQRGLTSETIVWAFTTTSVSNWHPVTWLSYLLDVELFGLSPGLMHFENVLWHVLNTLLLGALLHRLTGAFWRSAFVAALFAWHPLHVESVAWVSERKDVLSTFFWLLTMWAYTKHVQEKSRKWFAVSLVSFAIGLMAKPMLVTLPCVLILMEIWPFKRAQIVWNWESLRQFLIGQLQQKWPFFALTALCAGMTLIAQSRDAVVSSVDLPFFPRLQNALISYVAYLLKMIWPTNLAAYYEHPQELPWWQFLGALAIVVGIIFVIVRQWHARPWLGFGCLWYFGTLVPVIGLVQVGDQALADRYTYVPLIGIFIVIAWGLGEVAARAPQIQRACIGVGVVMLFLCLPVTAMQVQTWRNSITLFERAVKVQPHASTSHNNLAVALDDAGRMPEAKAHYEKAVELGPHNALALNNLGNMLATEGNFSRAAELYLRAIESAPRLARAHFNLALTRMSQGNFDQAIVHLLDSERLDPEHAKTQFQLAELYASRNLLEDAEHRYKSALRLDPGLMDAALSLGLLYLRQGRFTNAVAPLNYVLERQPESAVARYRLALAAAGSKQFRTAIGYLQEVLKLKPDWDSPVLMLARMLATNPDASIRNGREAVRLGELAVQLTQRKNPMALDTLAAAHAEAGNFGEAVARQEEAIMLARKDNLNVLATNLATRLDLYKAGKPFHEVVEE